MSGDGIIEQIKCRRKLNRYESSFKQAGIDKLLQKPKTSIAQIAKEMNVSTQNLWRWFNEYRRMQLRLHSETISDLLSVQELFWVKETIGAAEADKIRPLLPEKQFINISEKTLNDKTYNLYDIKTKYTVVYFWSAGCESCKINLDQLETFYKKYKRVYDVEIFSIDLDNNMEESIAFQQKHPFDWIVLKSNSTQLK